MKATEHIKATEQVKPAHTASTTTEPEPKTESEDSPLEKLLKRLESQSLTYDQHAAVAEIRKTVG